MTPTIDSLLQRILGPATRRLNRPIRRQLRNRGKRQGGKEREENGEASETGLSSQTQGLPSDKGCRVVKVRRGDFRV